MSQCTFFNRSISCVTGTKRHMGSHALIIDIFKVLNITFIVIVLIAYQLLMTSRSNVYQRFRLRDLALMDWGSNRPLALLSARKVFDNHRHLHESFVVDTFAKVYLFTVDYLGISFPVDRDVNKTYEFLARVANCKKFNVESHRVTVSCLIWSDRNVTWRKVWPGQALVVAALFYPIKANSDDLILETGGSGLGFDPVNMAVVHLWIVARARNFDVDVRRYLNRD
jgi:hypothetical protein